MGKHALSGIVGFDKRGGEIFFVDPAVIKVDPTWNHRKKFAKMDELIASIKENGVKTPLKVRKTKEGVLVLVMGERRLRAVLQAIKDGFMIKSIPVVVARKDETELDLYVESIIENDSELPTPTEEAASFKRLVNWKMSVAEISKKTGRSISHVRNRLELANATPEVKAAVDAGEITVRDAQAIVAGSDGKVQAQSEALEDKLTEPKATRKKGLTLSFKDGEMKYSGLKNTECDPLSDLLIDCEFRDKLFHAGFDPYSIKIQISQREGE